MLTDARLELMSISYTVTQFLECAIGVKEHFLSYKVGRLHMIKSIGHARSCCVWTAEPVNYSR